MNPVAASSEMVVTSGAKLDGTKLDGASRRTSIDRARMLLKQPLPSKAVKMSALLHHAAPASATSVSTREKMEAFWNHTLLAASLFGAISVTLLLTPLERSWAFEKGCVTCLDDETARYMTGGYYLILSLTTMGMINSIVQGVALLSEFTALAVTVEDELQFMLDHDVTAPSDWFVRSLQLTLPAIACGTFVVAGYVAGCTFTTFATYSAFKTRHWYGKMHCVGMARLSQRVREATGKDWKPKYRSRAEAHGYTIKGE
eukprot:g1561.t1